MGIITKFGFRILETGAKAAMSAEKHSPELLVGAGLIMGVAAGVSACKATLKAEEVLDEIKEDIETVKEAAERAPEEKYSKADKARDLTVAYSKGAGKLCRLYWKPLLLGGLSIASILSGHNILRRRHLALVCAYGTLEKSYEKLYKRVASEFSEDAANRFSNGLKPADDPRVEKGKKGAKNAKISLLDPDKVLGPYTYIFGPDNPQWTGNLDYDIMFLQGHQRFANDCLTTRGYLTLSSLFQEMHNYEWMDKGSFVTGWVLPEHYYQNTCEPYINFNISRVFKDYQDGNGPVEVLMLNFNCDGYIWDKIV